MIRIYTVCHSSSSFDQAKFVTDDTQIFVFVFFFLQKISFDISCEYSAKQTVYIKCQDLFSLKYKNKRMLSVTRIRFQDVFHDMSNLFSRKLYHISEFFEYLDSDSV